MRIPKFIALTALCTVLGAPALAQVMSAPETQNGITFVTGGVGRDRAEAFRQAAPDFNLRATFSAQGGAFLAKVGVELRDAQGKPLVKTTTQGPFFFAKVPPGTYTLVASVRDQTAQRQLLVSPGAAATADISFNVPAGK